MSQRLAACMQQDPVPCPRRRAHCTHVQAHPPNQRWSDNRLGAEVVSVLRNYLVLGAPDTEAEMVLRHCQHTLRNSFRRPTVRGVG